MYVMNLGKPTKVAKLNEAMAIELGANLMGEVIIFSVAGGCLILEYNRQVAKEMKKEEARLQQLQKFTDDIEKLNKMTSVQQREIQYLQEAFKELAKHTRHKLSETLIVAEANLQEQHHTDTDKNTNTGLKTNTETHNKENEKRSIIERAIVYYENDVKAYKFS